MVRPAAEAPLMVAATTVDVTPPAGLPLGGYVLREGAVASGTHDPLLASLVWVRDARPRGGEVFWVALDALAIDGELGRTIQAAIATAAGCAPEAVLVCASHTHSSAAGWFRGLRPSVPDTADEKLRRRLTQKLAVAAEELPARLEPCWPLLGEGLAPDAGGNRNHPAGPHDPSVGAFGLVDVAGRVVAAVLDYASHATVLGYQNMAWSADWPGAARRTLADAVEGAAWFGRADDAGAGTRRRPTIAILQGAAGDASPRFARRNQGFAEVERLGGLVAAAGLTALLQAAPAEEPAPVSVARRTVSLPTRRLPARQALSHDLAEAELAWKQAQAAQVPAAQERIARTRYEGALTLLSLADAGLPPTVEASIRAVSVGGAAWVHLPVELFASFGLAIRHASPFGWTRVIGYADDYVGYVADAEAHRDGVYEALASHFDVRAGETLVQAALARLKAAAISADAAAAARP